MLLIWYCKTPPGWYTMRLDANKKALGPPVHCTSLVIPSGTRTRLSAIDPSPFPPMPGVDVPNGWLESDE